MKKSLVFTILVAAALLFLYSCSPEPTTTDPQDGQPGGTLPTSNNEDIGRTTHRSFKP